MLNEKKDSSYLTELTHLTLQIIPNLTRENFGTLLSRHESNFSTQLQTYLNDQNQILPIPNTDKEVTLVIMISLLFYKEKKYPECEEILSTILFEEPH